MGRSAKRRSGSDGRGGAPPGATPQGQLTSAQAFHRAGTLRHLGKFAEAEALLRDALTRDPGNSTLHNVRGMMFSSMGRPRDALWCFREALAINPRGADIWANLGTTLEQPQIP